MSQVVVLDGQRRWQQLQVEADKLTNLIRVSRDKLVDLDGKIMKNMSRMTSAETNALISARRIVRALETRLQELNAFLLYRAGNTVEQAEELMRKNLVIPSDPMTTVLDATPIRPLRPSDWKGTLEALFSRVEAKIPIRHAFG
ncbi:MAG: hypothetical protein KDD66_01855 [Bdellovibrionales bacterium]|nr:hypothetical protein [Bdellovibrionales bacterium]